MAKKKKKKKSIFFPQAFLVYQYAYGSSKQKLKESSLGENGNEYNKVVKVKGSYQPEVVVSKLVNVDGVKVDNHLLNLENHKISALVPELRLYRSNESDRKNTPFYFPVASEFIKDGQTKLDLANRSFSGGAAVIQSFQYSMSGVNPYQITRKFLNASLTIKVDNISVLFDRKPGYAILADLFTIRAGGKNTTPLGMNKSIESGALTSGQSCKIVATLGYSVPRNYRMFTADEIITIEQTKQIMNLYYSGHDLSIQPDGAAVVSIKYTGYLETIKNNSNFDFLSNGNTKALQNRRASKQKETAGNIQKIFNPEDDKKNPNNKPDEEETQEDFTAIDAFSELLTDLYSRKKIYSVEFDKKFFTAKPRDDDEEEEEDDPQDKPGLDRFFTSVKKHMINYITFGDFVDSYFKKLGKDLDAAIKKNMDKKKENSKEDESDKNDVSISRITQAKEDLALLNILMCDIKVKRKKETSEGPFININIADVPISIDNLYTKIWKDITKQDLGFYDMNKFLSFCHSLLDVSLDLHRQAPMVEDVNYKMSTYTARELKRKINRGVLQIDDASKFTDSFSKDSKLSEFIVFSQEASRYSKSPGSGRRSQDTKKGIFHLRPNKDRGFLKNVSFSKMSMPSREASLVVGNGDLYDELRIPHNASATMFGNFMFLPGSQVFVDPNTLGFGSVKDKNSAARRLGFGGYYTVETVSTSFSGGRLETTLSLLFNAFPETDSEPTAPKGSARSLLKLGVK